MAVDRGPLADGPSRWRRAWQVLDDRLGLSAFAYPVPRHANAVTYMLGGITLGSFLLLVATGIYLGQFYDPQPALAHSSVVAISEADFGSLVRSVHFWLSTIFVVTVSLHLLRTFVTASYKRPREATWITGVVLFAIAGGLLYSGTILKWDQEAFEALEHNSEIADLLGVFGFWFSPDFSGALALLTRVYIAHVSLLPVIFVGVVAVHLLLVKRHGVSPLPWGSAAEVERRERNEERGPFTAHLARILYWTLLVLALALLLSALRPTGIGPEGVAGIEVTKPPWYFLWLYPFENWFGLDPLVIVPGILLAGLAAIPFLDRSPERDPRRRPVWIGLAALALIAWAFLTIYGFVTEPVAHVA